MKGLLIWIKIVILKFGFFEMCKSSNQFCHLNLKDIFLEIGGVKAEGAVYSEGSMPWYTFLFFGYCFGIFLWNLLDCFF